MAKCSITQWEKSSFDCSTQCTQNAKCKGFTTNSKCETYDMDLPYNSGSIDVNDIWIRGKCGRKKTIGRMELPIYLVPNTYTYHF